MKEQACEQLTLFQVDSPVSRSVLPGSTEARKMTVISGQKCYELYGNYAHLGSLVRMCLASSIWHSTRCLLTWKAWGTKHSRLLFQLAVSMPPTDDTESQFWPTPKASAVMGGCSGARKHLQRMADKGLITEEERLSLSSGNCGKTNPEFVEWLMGYEQQFTKLQPTASGIGREYVTKHTVLDAKDTNCSCRERIQWEVKGTCGSQSPWENWSPEPSVGRVADGIPNRVDRIRCLGNAVVPQQFYIFFKLIYDIERSKK